MTIRRFLPLAGCALLLAGCDQWTAATQLIAPAERDEIGVAGAFESGEVTMTVTPLSGRRYRIVYDDGSGQQPAGGANDVRAAFDLLRSQPVTGEDGRVSGYRNTFLIEIERPAEEGPSGFAYDIIVIDSDGFIEDYDVQCSAATVAIIGAEEEGGGCAFTTYGQLRAAAADALAWADDARMAIKSQSFAPAEQ